jgi:plastocyanin
MLRHLLIAGALALSLVSVPSRAETIQVVIDNLAFSPAEIEVKVGDTVEWVNKDIFDHTATVKGGWDVNIPAGTSSSLVIETAEAATYYCRFHPNMIGKVISTEP